MNFKNEYFKEIKERIHYAKLLLIWDRFMINTIRSGKKFVETSELRKIWNDVNQIDNDYNNLKGDI